MLSPEQLSAYLDGSLDPAERAEVEQLLAGDPEAQRQLADQQRLDQALRVVLGNRAAHERVKQSILAVVRGVPLEQLKEQVMEATADRQARPQVVPAGKWWQRIEIVNWLKDFTAPRFVRYAAMTTAVVALGIGSFFIFRPQPIVRIQIGQFAAVMGTPKVQHAGKPSTRNPQPSTVVYLGDRIETGDADKAEIKFRDGTTLRLNFNTALEIPNPKSEIQNPKSPLSRPSEINLLRGQIWSKVQKTTNAPQFAVRTPVATATVTGTEFGLKVQKTKPAKPSTLNPRLSSLFAILTVKEGAVEFSNPFGKVQATALTESQAGADSAPTSPKRLPSLKVFRLGSTSASVITTARPSLPEASPRLVYDVGWAGLEVAEVSAAPPNPPADAQSAPRQIQIIRVQRASPAEQTGLRVTDVITAVNGRLITNAWQILAAIAVRPNAMLALTLQSGADQRAVTLATSRSPEAPPPPLLSEPVSSLLAESTRLLLERRSVEGESALETLLATDAGPAAHNNLGLLAETRDELGKAIAHYQQAAQAAPEVPLYHFNLGRALENVGNLERAEEEFASAVRLAPKWEMASEALADICTLLDRFDESLQAADASLSLHPQSPDAWTSKAAVLVRQHRSDEARQAFLKAIELEPTFAAAYRDLGDLHHDTGQTSDALQVLQKAIELDPSDAEAFSILGNVYSDLGRLDEAEQTLRKAIALNPSHAIHYSNLGLVYRQRGQPDEAEQMYRKAIEIDPANPIPYANLGELYRRMNRLEEAERMLRMGIDLDPQNMTAYNNLAGLYHYNRRQFDAAEKMYLQALAIDATYVPLFYNLGYLYVDTGKLDDAEKMFRKSIEVDPKFAPGYGELGYVHKTRGQLDEAEKMYRKAIEVDPTYTIAYNQLARICASRDQFDEAQRLYRKVLELEPNTASACNNLARLLADTNSELDEALTLAQQATRLAPTNPAMMDTLGWVQCQRGELAEAEATLNKALELAGENPPASQIREHLKKVGEKKGDAPK